MSYFKAKMHQIRFRLGLRSRSRWGSLQRSSDPPAGFKGPASKEKKEEGRRKGGKVRGKGRGKTRLRGERKGEGVDIAWSDLYLSQRDATAAALSPVWF